MRFLFITAIMLGLAVAPVSADEGDVVRLESNADYNTTVNRLVSSIEAVGAKVLGRIDHGGGARSIGKDIGNSELFIFGNPVVGTPLMEKNRLAALYLPVKILIYEAPDGKVWVAYNDDTADQIEDLDGINEDDPMLNPVRGAVAGLSRKAAGQN